MNELPQLPADFCEGYWQAVVEELMDGGLDAETAQAAVQEYREYMKPAGWTIYNDRIEESAKMAKLGLQNGTVKSKHYRKNGTGTGTRVKLKVVAGTELKSRKLPDESEIAALPRWARVAMAARCARRVQPVFKKRWASAPETHLTAIENAISAAENAAANNVLDVFEAIIMAAGDAGKAVDGFASVAAYAASNVAYAASNAARTARGASVARDANIIAADAAATARYADTASADVADSRRQIRSDFIAIATWSQSNSATDATPCPPVVAGPLWPDGPPEGWPELPTATRCKLQVRVPDGVRLQDGLKQITKLAELLGKLDIAGGGHGLRLKPPLGITKAKTRVPVKR